MKTLLNSGKKIHGGAMLITMVIVGIAATTVVAYLYLVQGEYTTAARSQTWNSAMVLAEAGVEDAMAMVNKYTGTSTSLTNWSSTATADGWTVSGNVYHMSRTNDGVGYYDVYVTNVVDLVNFTFTPCILSIGQAYWNVSSPTIGSGISSNVVVASYTGNAIRKVFVRATGDSSAAGGLTAQYVMNFNGNKSTVDSYNSADPSASLWHTNWFFNGANYGTYSSTYRTANVIVGTDGQLLDAAGASIYGYVNTGPGGSVSIQSGGSVGDLSWIGSNPNAPVHTGIQSGHQRDDMNILFPPVSLPTASTWLSIPQPTNFTIRVGGLLYTNNNNPYKSNKSSSYTIGGADYSLIITNINGNPGTPTNKIYYAYASQLGQSLFIDASNVVLSLPNGIGLNSGDNLTINTNASIAIYSGSDISTGNGLVNNNYQYAGALAIYGLPNCKNISFGGNAALTVNLYAPAASVSFNGGGSTTYDVCGAMMVANITVNGHYNFHFDEVLKMLTPPTRFVPAYWQEVY